MELKIEEIAKIGIVGPTQCGKSLVMHELKKILEDKYGATVILNAELKAEFNAMDYDNVDDWQKKLVTKTIWKLQE